MASPQVIVTIGRALFFMHVEKTGGTSLERWLRSHFSEAEVFPVYSSKDWKQVDAQRLGEGHALYMGHSTFDVFDALPAGTLTVTLLRDPVDHCISTYNHVRLREDSHKFAEFEAAGMTFERYVREVLPKDANLGRYAQATRLVGASTRRRIGQSSTSREEADRRMIERAKENLVRFDILGLTEHLQRTADAIAVAMGWGAERIATVNTAGSWATDDRRPVRRVELPEGVLEELRAITQVDRALYDFAKTLPNAVR